MFIFQQTNNEGEAIGKPVKCKTVVSVSAMCPMTILTHTIDHVCAMARENPNYPYDITDCSPSGMNFSARLIWSEDNVT